MSLNRRATLSCDRCDYTVVIEPDANALPVGWSMMATQIEEPDPPMPFGVIVYEQKDQKPKVVSRHICPACTALVLDNLNINIKIQ